VKASITNFIRPVYRSSPSPAEIAGYFFEMKFLEKDLEQIIFETSEHDLDERGLFVPGKRLRQVNIGNYGIADMITYYRNPFDKEIVITVFELKKDFITPDAFLQAIRYCKGIREYLKHRDFNSFEYEIKYNIVLVGSDIEDKSGFIYLTDFFENISFYTYSYKFDGIFFKEENGYHLIKSGF